MEHISISLQNEKACLVVVDMVNGFVFEGALSDSHINGCTKPILDAIEQFKAHSQPILAFADTHNPGACEFASFPPHCLEGTNEAELIDEIKAYENDMILLKKNSTNGFVQPEFLTTFQSLGPLNKVIITGCCTDICVLQFALSLKGYLNQNNLKTEVIIPTQCIDTFDSPLHSRAEYTSMALTLMKNAGIQIVNHIQWEE